MHKKITIYSNLFVIILNLIDLNFNESFIANLFTIITTIFQISCFVVFYKKTVKPENELELLIRDILVSFKKKEDTQSFFCDDCHKYVDTDESHCFFCEKCIKNKHHHCTWLDSCITSKTLQIFNLLILFSLFSTGILCYNNLFIFVNGFAVIKLGRLFVFLFSLLQSLFYFTLLCHNLIFIKYKAIKIEKEKEKEINEKMRQSFLRNINL